MAQTLTQLQTAVAYRMSESSVPSGSEYNRRTQFLNEAYKTVARKHYWWWTEASDTFNSVANQTSYGTADGLPSDLRGSSILELRYNSTLYTPATQSEVFDLQTQGSGLSQRYYIFGGKLWPVAPFTETLTDSISIKYYKIPATLSSGSDTILIPDEFSDMLVAFTVGRLTAMDSERGSAADAYDEFNEILKDMEKAQNDYLFALKQNTSDVDALYL